MKTSTVKVPAHGTWYVIDATDQNLGRMAANIAHVLRGKHRAAFSPHQLSSDHVVVVNVEKMGFDAMKLKKKQYFHHTGYFGHNSWVSLEKMMAKDPRRVLEIAVKGMLRNNRLRPRMIQHLHLIVGAEHPFAAQKPVPLTFTV